MEPPMGQPMSKSDEELEIQALRRVISAYIKYVGVPIFGRVS